MAEVTLRINDRQVTAQKGRTILEAALANGIEIPNLCYDVRLSPTGACRLCLVQVDGAGGVQTACTTEIQPGMIVRTETTEIREIRKTILELLFNEHKGACTTCDETAGANCNNMLMSINLVKICLLGLLVVSRPRTIPPAIWL